MNHVKHVIPMSDSSVSIKPEDIQPTVLPDAFIQSDIVRKLNTLSLPRYNQLPNMTLYRDQVIEYVALWMEPLSICVEHPVITPSMINNYVKVGLVPAPVKKQYGREQIARLIAICLFKQVLPIAAVQALFNIQRLSYDAPTAFDYVVDQLEASIRSAFSVEQAPVPDTAHQVTRESLLVRSAVSSFVSKAYLMSYLKFNGFNS